MRPGKLGITVVLIAVAALSTGCGLSLQELPLGRSGPGDTYYVTAEFTSADRIDLGAEVRAGQAVVGRVHSMETDGRRARLQLSMSESAYLPANVAASVRLPSALGSPYIQIDMPEEKSSQLLAEGDVIERTEVGPDIESTFAMLGQVVNGSGLDQLSTITTELDAAFGNRGESIRAMLTRLDTTMTLADDNSGHLERTLLAVDSVAERLAQQQELIDNGIADSARMVDLLAAQHEDLRTLVSSTSSVVASMDAVMAHGETIGDSVDDVAEITAGIRDFNNTVGSALVEMNTFIDGFNSAVHGDYLLFDGAFDIPAAIDLLVTGGMPLDGGAPLPLPQADVAEGLADLLGGGTR
ncbi:MCE family protein [Rhodococcus chondri]|uniref:MCE family protein n=1 Tax=Rhodococcus chondri TaxID=3065941 RepID=A0ABU7JL96_9NOCA|nr:MCE family protein [Rhodococcus sp. CC-R104]MEE2030816.1 MCE family protein [Rhodococcus sp. CC-R104]